MLPYFIMVGIPATFALYNNNKHSRKINRTVINSFFSIWLFLLMFRSVNIGTDTSGYKYLFQSVTLFSWKEIFEFIFSFENEAGYYIISKIILLFTDDFQAMLILTAVLSIVPIWKMYKNHETNNPYLMIVILLCIGVFPMYFSGIRQVLAMAFVAPAYKFTKEKKFFQFLLMVFLAFLFHKSAFILLLLYPVYYFRIRWKYSYLIILPMILVIYYFRTPIFTFFVSFLNDFYSGEIQNTGAIAIFLLLMLFLVFSFVIPSNSKLDDETVGLRNLLILSTVIQIFAGIHFLAMRLNYYYLLFIPMLLPKIINNASQKMKKIVTLAVIVMTVFFTVYYFYNAYVGGNKLDIYPYEFFWSQS